MNKTTTFLKNLGKIAGFALIGLGILTLAALPGIVLGHYFGGWGVTGYAIALSTVFIAWSETIDELDEYDRNNKNID